jgi:hypothetical protein
MMPCGTEQWMAGVEASDVSEAVWRSSEREQARVRSLLRMAGSGATALDIGARDGYVSVRLAQSFAAVTALDLSRPNFDSAQVTTIAGDVTALPFPDRTFECVVCAEVLEHLEPAQLPLACRELTRVTGRALVIGVPYREDRRVAAMRCHVCRKINAPWGHLSSFDSAKLRRLFSELNAVETDFVGPGASRTNAVSATLMRMAGNPYGTYDQDEPCTHCGARLRRPPRKGIASRATARAAVSIEKVVAPMYRRRPNWIHVKFEHR